MNGRETIPTKNKGEKKKANRENEVNGAQERQRAKEGRSEVEKKNEKKTILLASKSPNREISRTSTRDAAGANQQHGGGG